MEITVRVAEEHLRGIRFERYAKVLLNLLDFTYGPDGVTIKRGDKTTVTISGQSGAKLEAEILSHAKEITLPDFVDGLFSFREWKKLYGKQKPATVPADERKHSTSILPPGSW